MPRWFLILALVASLAGPAWAGLERLDPVLRALVHAQTEGGPAQLLDPQVLVQIASASVDGVPLYPEQVPPAPDQLRVRVFVQTRTRAAAHALPGFQPRQAVGRLATGEVAVPDLPALSDHPEVVYVAASRPLSPTLDLSVPEVGAPALWYSTLSTTGQGVIVGVVDSGIDVLHKDFRTGRAGDELKTRIVYLWDQTAPGGWMPPWWGDAFTERRYGRVFTQNDLEAAIAAGTSPTTDTLGHGTHVAGIAAGDGTSSTLGLRGVAPGADLVVVKTTFYEDDVVDGVRFVFEAAATLGRPAVVNLSLGGHAGPHDGTSLFEQMLDALVDRPGRAVVVSAGNEGDRKVHVGADVWARTTWHLVAEKGIVGVQLWHPAAAGFTVRVTAPTEETVTAPPGTTRWAPTASGSVQLDNAVSIPPNGDRVIYISLIGAERGSRWTITLDPVRGGRVDGWVEDPAAGWFMEGDGDMAIAEPGNARRVITVGAYVTKNRWTSLAGEQSVTEGYPLGALAPFSSRGPTRDGRLKPDLAAPGAWIASARSRDAPPSPWLTLPDREHSMLLGTSMAAPHVTGAVALLLSRNPGLDWQDLKKALTGGARRDPFVGPAPNDAWGAGKLDVPRAADLVSGGGPGEASVLAALANPVDREAVFRYRWPEGATWAELHVYDIAGNRLAAWRLTGREGEIRWNLRAADGRPVASGLYLVVLVTDRGRSEVVRLVVQR
jgi:subtilisin family serine protease